MRSPGSTAKSSTSPGVVINQAARSSALMPTPNGLVVLMLIEQDQLIEEHGPEGQELAAASACDGPLPTPLKEVLE